MVSNVFDDKLYLFHCNNVNKKKRPSFKFKAQKNRTLSFLFQMKALNVWSGVTCAAATVNQKLVKPVFPNTDIY